MSRVLTNFVIVLFALFEAYRTMDVHVIRIYEINNRQSRMLIHDSSADCFVVIYKSY